MPACRTQPPAFEDRIFRELPLAGLLLATLAAILGGRELSTLLAPLPWIVSLAVVGLPHGAADLALAKRLCVGPLSLWVFGLYLAAMGAVLALFILLPGPLVLLFTALSIWHFGLGHADGQRPPIPPGAWPQVRAAVARGASVLGVPMACWPLATSQVVLDLLSLMGTTSTFNAAGWFAPAGIDRVGIALVVAAACALAAEAIATRHVPGAMRRSWNTLVDLSIIGLLGVVADPLFSIGFYFLFWHAWRHMRLLAIPVARIGTSDPSSLGIAMVRLHWAALPLLIPTWIALLGGWWLLSPQHTARDLAILSLAVYLVVTPSHDLLVDLLRAQNHSGTISSGHRHSEVFSLKGSAPTGPPSAHISCVAPLACSPSSRSQQWPCRWCHFSHLVHGWMRWLLARSIPVQRLW